MPLDDTAAHPAAQSDHATALATETMARLRSYFATRDHHPSAEHWLAIGDVVNTLNDMANGTCRPEVFLSALDPGVGKSSAVTAFAAALTASSDHQHVGMIVCVGRIEEAKSIATGIREAHPQARIAILTSDDDANELSTIGDATDAQVLITTQQRIEISTNTKGFEECASLFYRGTPRAVRAWDEAWLPGVTITASKYDLLGILGVLARRSQPCADAVERFALSFDKLKDGEPVAVPNFEGQHDVSFQAIGWQYKRDDIRRTFQALAALSGRTARLRSDGHRGMRVLTYRDTLPDDLAPLLVLDASGRVRETYKFIESHRGGLTKLRRAVKDYGPLTVKLWQRAGSKYGWARDGEEMVKEIVKTIQERPSEQWLIVAHKPERGMPDVGGRVKRKLPRVNVECITWGQHLARNDYSDVPNVILAGTLFMAQSYYTALTHLAQDRSVEHGFAPGADVKTIEHGEHANVILQAVCRGRVRKSDGDRCLPMTAYIIASGGSGIPGIIEKVFPGCSVVVWRENETKPPRVVLRALKFVDTQLSNGAAEVTNTDLRDHLGLTDTSNLRNQVLKHRSWLDGLQRRHLGSYVSAGRVPGGVRPLKTP